MMENSFKRESKINIQELILLVNKRLLESIPWIFLVLNKADGLLKIMTNSLRLKKFHLLYNAKILLSF